jgi:peptidoglycan/LPS O-acetylase OafA/YrhL
MFIDNLRWSMIFLVISMHAADTYSPFGSWYFVDRRPLPHWEVLAFGAWQTYLQSFFMGLLFFTAGYFVPASFDKKGPAKFLRDRAFRLGLPVVFYMFVLGPVTEYFIAHSWTSTRPTSFPAEWIKHIRNGEFLQENGPLWFCLALLMFSAVYVIWPVSLQKLRISPAGFALAMAVSSYLVRLTHPHSFLNMNLGDFPQYILMFSAGVVSAREQFLEKIDAATAKWWALTLPFGFALWLTIAILGQGQPWRLAAFCLWEAFTCVAISIGLIVLFRERWNTQGRLEKILSDNAFSVYVFHPPIVIFAARLLHGLEWDSILKFAMLTAIGILASYTLSAVVFRRIPILKAIL